MYVFPSKKKTLVNKIFNLFSFACGIYLNLSTSMNVYLYSKVLFLFKLNAESCDSTINAS